MTPEALAYLAKESYDPAYGARPVQRTMQQLVLSPLAGIILSGEVISGQTIRIGYDPGEEKVVEGAEGADEGVAKGGVIAAVEMEDAVAGGELLEGVGGAAGVREIGLGGFEEGEAVIHDFRQGGGFELPEAALAPEGGDHELDEGDFVGGVGEETLFEGFDGFLVEGSVFAGEDEGFGGETVTEGVHAGAGLAFGGDRSAGFRSVGSSGFDFLEGGWHCVMLPGARWWLPI